MGSFLLADFGGDFCMVFFISVVACCWYMTRTIGNVAKAAGPFATRAATRGFWWWLTH